MAGGGELLPLAALGELIEFDGGGDRGLQRGDLRLVAAEELRVLRIGRGLRESVGGQVFLSAMHQGFDELRDQILSGAVRAGLGGFQQLLRPLPVGRVRLRSRLVSAAGSW